MYIHLRMRAVTQFCALDVCRRCTILCSALNTQDSSRFMTNNRQTAKHCLIVGNLLFMRLRKVLRCTG